MITKILKTLLVTLFLLHTFSIVKAQQTDFDDMKKRIKEIRYEIETENTKLGPSFNITITFPKNYFAEEAIITVNPTFSGICSAIVGTQVFVGSKIKSSDKPENSVVVNYSGSGCYSFKIIPKVDKTKVGELKLDLVILLKCRGVTQEQLKYPYSETFAYGEGKIETKKAEVKVEIKDNSKKKDTAKIVNVKDNHQKKDSTEIVINQNTSSLNDLLSQIAEYKKAGDTKKLVELNQELGNKYLENKDYTAAKTTYLEAIENSKQNNTPIKTGDLFTDVGKIDYMNEDNFEAINDYSAALEYYKNMGDNKRIELTYNNLAIVYTTMSYYQNAIKSYQEAIKNSDNDWNTAKYITKIANCYNSMEQLSEAAENYEKVIKLETKSKNTNELISSYNNASCTYVQMGSYEKAIEYMENAMKLNENNLNVEKNASLLNNYGSIFLLKENFTNTLNNYNKSLQISESTKNNRILSIVYHNVGLLYYQKKDIDKARDNFIKSNEIAQTNGFKDIITKNMFMLSKIVSQKISEDDNFIKFESFLIESNPELTEYDKPIFDYQEKYLDTIDKNQLIYEISLKEQTVNNQNESIKKQKLANEVLLLEKNAQESKNKQQSRIIKFLIFGLIIVLIFAIWAIFEKRLKQKALEELKDKNLKINQQAEYLKQANEEINVINEDLNNQKEELSATLTNLQNTQNQLIKAEKMSALSQLISGIAHELNTPLGAIKSSIGSIHSSLSETTSLFPKLILKLDLSEFQIFEEMIKSSQTNVNHYNSRELRQLKKDLSKKLESQNIENNDEIIDYLVDLKLFDNFELFEKLTHHKENLLIFRTAYNIINQHENSLNVLKAVENSSKIIFALKMYATNNNEEKVKTNINNSIENVLKLYRNQLSNRIELTTDFNEIPSILAFPDQLTQVWTNIIFNSIQAISNTGKIHVCTKKSEDKILISITDDGCGIGEEIKDKIFEPFFTTKPSGEGIGLGLDIVKRIVDTHDGTINFESNLKKGTTFVINLCL